MGRYFQLIRNNFLFILCLTATACVSDREKTVVIGKNQTEGNWVYTVSDNNEATLLWGDGSEKGENVVMFPGELGGFPVTTLGNGNHNVTSNNKISNNYVLIPTSVSSVSERAIYDYNDTAGWVFPKSIKYIADNAMLSSQGGTYYTDSGIAVENYVRDAGKSLKIISDGEYSLFTVNMGENGFTQPNGTYYIPSEMLNGEYKKTFVITADFGFKVSEVTIDNKKYDFLLGDDKQNTVTFTYTFTGKSSGISVLLEKDKYDDRSDTTALGSYSAPEIIQGAVKEGSELPGDVYEYVPINGGTTAKYENTMGVSTGEYYSSEKKLYKAVYTSQVVESPEYYSKAEVINNMLLTEGMVFGLDYDFMRLYNYYEEITAGPSRGTVSLYCTYLYKETNSELSGKVYVDKNSTNTAAFLAQKGADITITNLIADVYTSGRGPSEAGNFYGLGSAIHVDGGDASTSAVNNINKNTAYVKLISPEIPGTVNSMYALASGVLEISGGNIFSCSSGGHGPYVSTGGQILINTENTNLISKDGAFNIDSDQLIAKVRPAKDIASMVRNSEGDMTGVFGEHPGNVTVIVTGDEAGTALATDTGGGVIVANQVSTMTYGLRCAGVYSIGFNESWVYTYNSTLVSALDAGLVSASGGYIYAFNSDISGVMGIKTRAGGNSESDQTGVYVTNSRVSAYFDAEGMKAAYDVADPEQWDSSMAHATPASAGLNMFIDKANNPTFNEGSLDWWYKDKSLTPGYSGGNKFAVIYVENSSTPIYIKNTTLINKNYTEYGTLSEDAITRGEKAADNLLVSVESGGAGNIYFINENSKTVWDLTKENSETCELVGDMFVAAANESSNNPNFGSGSNKLNVSFENSQWTGTVITEDNTGITSLTFDKDSVWSVTENAVIKNLTLADVNNISSEKQVIITIAGEFLIGNRVIDEDMSIGNISIVLDPNSLTEVEGSGGPMGMPPDGMGMPPDGMGMPPEGMGMPPEGMGMPPGEMDIPAR